MVYNKMAIPKIIHLIWVGTRPLPDSYIENIKKWATLNPDFTIKLWGDSQGTLPTIAQKTADKIATADLGDRVQLVDVNTEGMMIETARYEIDRMRPNYGAASDILRYEILREQGGAYFDCDVTPPDTPLAAIKVTVDSTEQDLFGEAEIDFALPGSSDEHHHLGETNNDILISSTGGQLITQLAATVNQFYQSLLFDKDLDELDSFGPRFLYHRGLAQHQTLEAQLPTHIEQGTIQKTGPLALLPIMRARHAEDPNYAVVPISHELLRKEGAHFDTAKGWFGIPARHFEDFSSAFNCAQKELLFELKSNGVFRLDDLILTLQESLELNDQELTDLIPNIISTLNTSLEKEGFLPLHEHIKAAQLTFKYPETERFYREHSCLEKTFLLPSKHTSLADAKSFIIRLTQPFQRMHEGFRDMPELSETSERFKICRLTAEAGALHGLANFYRREIHKKLDNGTYTSEIRANFHSYLKIANTHITEHLISDISTMLSRLDAGSSDKPSLETSLQRLEQAKEQLEALKRAPASSLSMRLFGSLPKIRRGNDQASDDDMTLGDTCNIM